MKPAGIASRGALTRQLRLFEGGTQREGHAIADAGPRSSWRLRSYYGTTVLTVLRYLRLHSVTASRRSAGAAGRRKAQSRTTGDGRARRRGTPMQSRTREGAGIAGWRLVRIRGGEARRPRRHAAYLSCVSRAARRPGGRRTVHRWLCSPLVTAGDAGGLETHHEAGGFAARLSRDARAERLRRASARVGVEDARGHSTPQTAAQIGGWAAKGDASP